MGLTTRFFLLAVLGGFSPAPETETALHVPVGAERAVHPIQLQQPAINHGTFWRPAQTPPGGTSWALLESTQEITRIGEDRFIYSRPAFPEAVRALEGRRITVAGWMMPLDPGARQSRFVLLAYPPGCPFHFHALPTQFLEVHAESPIRLDEVNVTTISGVLELTGEDESGVFYRMRDARQI